MARDPEDRRQFLIRRSRQAALVIATAMIAWTAVQFLGGRFAWDPRLALVFDMAAIVALFWGLWLVWQIYRERRAEEDENHDRK